jgi:hypothetical protein
MRIDGCLKEIILGILLASILLTTPVRAQWTVFDPANYKIQIKNQIDQLSRWMQTVNQYMAMYENAVGQLTNLKGLLRTADELLAHDKRMRQFISYWGQAIRMSLRVKDQLVNLVTGAARAVMNIERRLRNGIFDPEADKRDFAEYLRYGIGRTAQDAESEVERLKRMDNQLERILYDHQRESEQLAQLNAYIAAKKEEIERLKDCDDCTDKDRDMERLSLDIAQLEEKAAKAESDVSRLFDLKARRVAEIYKVEEERTRFGRTILTMNKAWRGITDATIKLREGLQNGR